MVEAELVICHLRNQVRNLQEYGDLQTALRTQWLN